MGEASPHHARQFQFVDAAKKELQKLKLDAQSARKVERCIERVVERKTRKRDVKPLRNGILEIRVEISDGKTLRILYSEVADNSLVLALHVFLKKTRKCPEEKIDLAEKRLKEWKHT